MKRYLIVLAAFAAGCQPLGASSPSSDASAPAQISAETACAARGGVLRAVGRAQTLQCVISYADAGEACRTGSDCLGDCRIENAPFPTAGAPAAGRCQIDSQPFGCHATVENGRATAAICVD